MKGSFAVVGSLLVTFNLLAVAQLAVSQDDQGLDLALKRYGYEYDLRNIEQDMLLIFYPGDDSSPPVETRERIITDFEGSRLLAERYQDGELVGKTVYLDGGGQYLDLATGEPADLQEPELDFFRYLFEQGPTRSLARLSEAVYEGRQSYAGLLEGEQFALPDDASKYLFDGNGRWLGTVFTVGPADQRSTEIEMLGEEREVGGFWFPFATKTYRLEGDTVRLIREQRHLELKVDQPLSDDLFTF